MTSARGSWSASGNGQNAAAGTQVEYARAGFDPLKRHLAQRLGVGARDQDARIDQKFPAIKGREAFDVLQRLARFSAGKRPVEPDPRLGGYFLVQAQAKRPAGNAERIRQ